MTVSPGFTDCAHAGAEAMIQQAQSTTAQKVSADQKADLPAKA